MAKEDKKKDNELKFSKEAIVNSKRYRDRKDLPAALLKDDREYSFREADEIINTFLEREVK